MLQFYKNFNLIVHFFPVVKKVIFIDTTKKLKLFRTYISVWVIYLEALLLLLFTVIVLSLGGSSPYTTMEN
jgi:hypothetical protein